MKRTLLLTALLLLIPTSLHAASADECRDRTNKELAREQRLYRSYLFGKTRAKDAPIGSVRHDTDGWVWMKIDDSGTPWRNSHPDNQDLEWSSLQMDRQDEHANVLPITGIFETKRVNTSEMIPYLLQSIRAMECRLDALCEIARISEIQSGDDPIEIEKIQPLGCIAYEDQETWTQCHFDGPDESALDQSDSRNYCERMADQLLAREIELLKLTVEYDAGYRSLLQFAGNFDIFLRELRWPLSLNIRNAVGLLGQLERIPCFLSSCDAAPPIFVEQ